MYLYGSIAANVDSVCSFKTSSQTDGRRFCVNKAEFPPHPNHVFPGGVGPQIASRLISAVLKRVIRFLPQPLVPYTFLHSSLFSATKMESSSSPVPTVDASPAAPQIEVSLVNQ